MPYKDPKQRAAQRKRWYEANKETVKEAAAAWKKRYPTRAQEQARRTKLKQRFGITIEQYYELLERQNNVCAVCRRDADSFKTALAVDHDHHSGVIRGLLCIDCNRRVIGRRRAPEGIALFQNASDYLKQDTGWIVPPKPKKKRKKRGKNPSNRTR